MNSLKNWIEQVRYSDQGTKKFWHVVVSGIAMVVVISLWIVYMDASVYKLTHTDEPQSIAAAQIPSQPSVFQTLKNGTAIAIESMGEGLNSLIAKGKRILRTTSSVTVQTSNLHFILKGIDPVPPKQFPK